MVRKIAHNIDIKVLIDSRESNVEYVKGIKLDQKRGVDKIKFTEIERVCVKPFGNESVGDISFVYKFIDEKDSDWVQANFSIERKLATDLFSSLYTKSNRERLIKEIEKSYKNKTDMYFIATDDLTILNKKVMAIRKFNEKACIIFLDNMLKFNELLMEYKIPFLTSGSDLGWLVRRLIKKHIKTYKLNYK